MGFAYRIVVEWSEDDDVYVARVPAFGTVAAHADTAADAVREAQVAAEGALEVMAEDGRAAPASDVTANVSGKLLARLPKSMHADLANMAALDGTSLNQKLVDVIGRGMAVEETISSFIAMPDPGKAFRAARAAAGLESKKRVRVALGQKASPRPTVDSGKRRSEKR